MISNEKKIIPIFFSSDDGYAPYLATALASMMDNASKNYNYKICVLNDGLGEEHQKKIKALEQDGFDIQFISMREKLEPMMEKESNKLRADYFTLTIYFRIFIPDMFPEYDKGIYIDSDIAVPGDISKLFEEDLEGNIIGACIDESIQDVPPLCKYIDESVGVDHTKYINSGVLLMDLEKLREVRMGDRFLELLNTYQFDSIAPDQDYINAMCYGKIHFIDISWDAFPNNDLPKLENPNLIHYNLFAKPWCYDNIQYEEYFWKYAKVSGYYDEIKAFKDAYSDEKKAMDSKNMEGMVVRALEIVDKGITFKSIFNTGKEERL